MEASRKRDAGAGLLGRSAGTVSREVRRSRGRKGCRWQQTHRQAVKRAKREGRAHVCKETIYKHVYADAKAGGDLWTYLPRAKRKRKRRCPRQEGRGRGMIPGRRGTETRPPGVELRTAVGHWEGDLVVGAGGSGYLVTLVERVTRLTLVGFSRTKEAGEVTAVIIGLLAGVGVACTLQAGSAPTCAALTPRFRLVELPWACQTTSEPHMKKARTRHWRHT